MRVLAENSLLPTGGGYGAFAPLPRGVVPVLPIARTGSPMPAPRKAGPYLRLSGLALVRHKAIRVENLNELIREVKARLIARVAPGTAAAPVDIEDN
jgi:hypothetical protein